MKTYLLIFVTFFVTEIASCQDQSTDKDKKDSFYNEFVKYFQTANFPFSTYNTIKVRYHDYEQDIVKRYICMDIECLKDWSGYDIVFASYVRFPSINNIYIVVIDETTDGGTLRRLITFDSIGNKLGSIDFFALKAFHGKRKQDEIVSFEIESVINEDYSINSKYFEQSESWTENEIDYFYGKFIEYKYQILENGSIRMLEKIDHGRKKYKGELFEDREIPRWDLAE